MVLGRFQYYKLHSSAVGGDGAVSAGDSEGTDRGTVPGDGWVLR